MRIHKLCCLLLFLIIGQLASAQPSIPQNRAPAPVLSVSNNGADAKGNKLYSVTARGQGTAEILRALFAHTGDQNVIDEDVAGTVDISVRNATLEQILQLVSEAARPPLRIRRDSKGLYKVSRELVAQPVGIDLGPGNVVPPGIVPNSSSVMAPGGYQQLAAGNRVVSLNIPKERPIPLADALRMITMQTGYNVVLDRRIPREVEFSGKIDRAPLSMVLPFIAEASKLKLTMNATGATFTAPDWLILRINGVILANSEDTACPGCGERVSNEWRYCPNCSRITPSGERELRGRGVPPKRPSRAGKIGGY